MKPSVSISAILLLCQVDTGVVLIGLQVVPVLDEFIWEELMGRDQVAVLATGVRHPPVVEEELVGRGHWVDAQLGQADANVDVLQVESAYAEGGLVDQLGHVP